MLRKTICIIGILLTAGARSHAAPLKCTDTGSLLSSPSPNVYLLLYLPIEPDTRTKTGCMKVMLQRSGLDPNDLRYLEPAKRNGPGYHSEHIYWRMGD
jgi:hypothetical protein